MIDSHAHYANPTFSGHFSYLSSANNLLQLEEGCLDDVFEQLQIKGIRCTIEPATDLDSNKRVLELCHQHPERMFAAIGVHPTRVSQLSPQKLRILRAYAQESQVVAIGETGLDFHLPPQEQHRLRQLGYFLYQIHLANRFQLPLILHVRQAHSWMLKLLKVFPVRCHGVIHCFDGGWDLAEQYCKLGFYLGIGGAVLIPADSQEPLLEAVRRIPLERILLETDSPFVKPRCRGKLSKSEIRRARNTSLILPLIADRIGELKGIPAEKVKEVTMDNTRKLFRI